MKGDISINSKSLLISFYTVVLVTSFSIFISCKDDSPTGSNNDPGTGASGSFNGEWTVDKIQMMQAPSGSSISALLKQALVPFGEVNGTFAGDFSIKFGSEVLSDVNTNLGIQYILGMKFFGAIGYPSGYSTSSTVVKKTANSGLSWNDVALPYQGFSNNTYISNETTLYQVYNSSNTVLIKSTNSGVNWNTVNSNIGFNLDNGGIRNDLFVTETVGYGLMLNGLIV